jgi:hypothetical protein
VAEERATRQRRFEPAKNRFPPSPHEREKARKVPNCEARISRASGGCLPVEFRRRRSRPTEQELIYMGEADGFYRYAFADGAGF